MAIFSTASSALAAASPRQARDTASTVAASRRNSAFSTTLATASCALAIAASPRPALSVVEGMASTVLCRASRSCQAPEPWCTPAGRPSSGPPSHISARPPCGSTAGSGCAPGHRPIASVPAGDSGPRPAASSCFHLLKTGPGLPSRFRIRPQPVAAVGAVDPFHDVAAELPPAPGDSSSPGRMPSGS